MGAVSSIAAIVATLAVVGSQAYQASQAGGGPDKSDLPDTSPTPVPTGKATQPDISNFAKERGVEPLSTPQGITFGGALNETQKRAQIATQGTAGDAGLYRTPQVQSFYKDLAIRSLTDESGAVSGSPLPVERQFARDVFGAEPRTTSTESFLSALMRS